MKAWKRAAIALGAVLVILALAPLFISLDEYIPQLERVASAKLKERVSIESLRAALLPYPHLTVRGLAIGDAQDVKAASITVVPDLLSLLGETKTIRTIEVDQPVLHQKAFEKIPLWSKSDGSAGSAPVRVRKIVLGGAVVLVDNKRVGPFDARISMNDAGEPQEASISTRDGKLHASVRPGEGKYLIELGATAWSVPVGPPLLVDELKIKGVATLQGARFEEVRARLYGGTASGTLHIGWKNGFQLTGRFDLQRIELKDIVPLLSPGNRMGGRLDAKPVLSARARTAAQLGSALRVETPFSVQNGVLYGIDMQKAATSVLTREPTGGETRFDALSGHLVMERGAYRFTQLKIASGVLAATGNVSISQSNELSGRLNAEVKASNIAAASVPLNVSGTVQSPLLLPTKGAVAGAAVGTAILGPGVGTSVGAKVGSWAEGLFGGKEEQR